MKRSAIKRRPLADTVLSNLEPETKEYRESYGVDRLYFVVSPSGRKRWEIRYKKPVTGRWAWMGIGTYPDVRSSAARSKAQEVAQQVAEGIDPVETRRISKCDHGRLSTFKSFSELWLTHRLDKGEINIETAYQIRRVLETDVIPLIGHTPISKVVRADCAAIQRRIEKREAFYKSKKCRILLVSIFEYAHAIGVRDDNPAAGMRISGKSPGKSKPFPFLREEDLPDLLRRLRKTSSGTLVRSASWLTIYLASRPIMIRWMHWDEIDLKEATWTIAAERMKSSRAFVSPLPHQAVAILKQLRPLAGMTGHVFPNRNAHKQQPLASGTPNTVISTGSINKCLVSLGFAGKMTSHGARHTAKTLLTEHGWPNDWSELQLAHALPGGGNATYNQALWLKPRSIMMQWYADYLDALELGMTDERMEAFDDQVLMPAGQRFVAPD